MFCYHSTINLCTMTSYVERRTVLDSVKSSTWKFFKLFLRERWTKKTEKKTDKCQFWPYIHTYSIKTDIFLFFSYATIEIVDKLLLLGKKQKKTDISLFRPTYIHTKLTFVSFFCFFLCTFPEETLFNFN